MPGITILDVDERGVLVVDLPQLIELIGDRALNSQWLIFGVDATGGEQAAELYRLDDKHIRVSGRHLLDITRRVWQVIDGRFEAFDGEQEHPWLVIYAVDGSAFDVVTHDNEVLALMHSSFKVVKDLPDNVLEPRWHGT